MPDNKNAEPAETQSKPNATAQRGRMVRRVAYRAWREVSALADELDRAGIRALSADAFALAEKLNTLVEDLDASGVCDQKADTPRRDQNATKAAQVTANQPRPCNS